MGAERIDAAPEPALVESGRIVYRTSLDRDRQFSIRYLLEE
jgi:hypothetical protein